MSYCRPQELPLPSLSGMENSVNTHLDPCVHIAMESSVAIALKVDVSDVEETLQMARTTINSFGQLDILINNAALVSRGSISRAPHHRTNDRGRWRVCYALIKVFSLKRSNLTY